MSPTYYDPSELMEKVLPLLAVIGRAHLHNGLHVADTLPLAQQCEVGAALDVLSTFGSLIEADAQRHERPE
ncbi:MAG: hypothetical protein LBI59_02540 [Candidatus Accumulibacter sp.]|jgi:hypothetical protein|nr:hypothetical protein [Accumulibacter sp.]